MKRSSGARLCSTAAIGALSLALLTGCSSDDGSKDSGKSGGSKGSSSSSSSSAADAKAPTSAELEKLLLAQGEVKGYKVTDGDDTLPTSKSVVKVDKTECAPLAWATAALPPGDTDAAASNTVTEEKASASPTSLDDVSEADIEDAFKVTLTFVGLSSYDGDGAQKAMKSVSDGVAACSGGFGLQADGEKSKITKVASEKGTGGGDEALAFSETVDMDGEGTATFHAEVIRKGTTVATFYTVNFAAFASGGDMGPVPAAVVTAQLGKLA
ncbi:hypothetical protein [Streptomyces sp. NBC_00582]|uniref:hypothetical protein n=1 Tax=Streptomyces sp. NBC_00582 TaxID=2975783 RepID=UPI0010632FBE|nr:hypothetical protein [Streptomyces sp. NBC_00582]WUB62277.1 hypothetical protein OG852_18700 [Streptomyces sp. NBC_00582]